MILKSKLHAKNKITAVGTLAVPVFHVINWRLEEIEKLPGRLERY